MLISTRITFLDILARLVGLTAHSILFDWSYPLEMRRCGYNRRWADVWDMQENLLFQIVPHETYVTAHRCKGLGVWCVWAAVSMERWAAWTHVGSSWGNKTFPLFCMREEFLNECEVYLIIYFYRQFISALSYERNFWKRACKLSNSLGAKQPSCLLKVVWVEFYDIA